MQRTNKFNEMEHLFPARLKTRVFPLLILVFAVAGNLAAQSSTQAADKSTGLLNAFHYSPGNSIIVSGHRGGTEDGFPENCLETFQHIFSIMPAFFEIDPRLTKDSVIVLMHDETIDRTTTGSGKISEYTWEELQQFRLKDHQGNATSFKIPRLDEVMDWSKGKTFVNLDKKDVPMEMIVALISKKQAEDHVMLTVHTGKQARFYHDYFPNIKLSAFCRNTQEYKDMANSEAPWENMIAYVGPTINEQNEKIVELLHANGVRCMISLAPTHDKLKTTEERRTNYCAEIAKKPDIIESDRPLEVGCVIREW